MGCFLELDRRSHDFCETDSTLAHGTLGASGIRAAGKGRLIRVHRNVCIGWKAAGPSMLGIGCPDRHALPRITPIRCADLELRPLPRERVRSTTLCEHSAFPVGRALHAPYLPFVMPVGIGSVGRTAALPDPM